MNDASGATMARQRMNANHPPVVQRKNSPVRDERARHDRLIGRGFNDPWDG